MEIVFVGAGRLATNFAHALINRGHAIKAVYSRTMESATALSSVVGGFATDNLDALPVTADVYIVAVKDSVLPQLLPPLISSRPEQHFFHTAGSVPLSVFGSVKNCGIIYPMQTFSKERLVDFSHVPIFIEGSNSQMMTMARSLALSVSEQVIPLSSADRRYLHLAAVFACNFANHCYALSARILEQHGLDFSVMVPLIEETARKVESMHPIDAQTGPAVRYDVNVIEAQRQLLADAPQLRHIYDIMSTSIHRTLKNEN